MATADKNQLTQPGEVLMEDVSEGFGIAQNTLAVVFGVPTQRINEIEHGKREKVATITPLEVA